MIRILSLVLAVVCATAADPAPAKADAASVASLRAAPPAVGSAVTMRARVAGRREPIVANRSVMMVVDVDALKPCNAAADDHCAMPWDMCCEDKQAIARNAAAVQMLGADGKVLAGSLASQVPGLVPGSIVTVTGTVAQADAAVLLVTATAIAVEPAKK